VITENGLESETDERVCSECFAAYVAAGTARQAEARAEVEARARDGTLFEEMRRELAPRDGGRSPQELAHAAAYLDKIATVLPVPLPDDLRAFADQHRSPAA
jgi:hypothetical protein